jgi:hypothetical protein
MSGQLHTGYVTPGQDPPDIYCTEGWVDPKASLDMMAKRKNTAPATNLNPLNTAFN